MPLNRYQITRIPDDSFVVYPFVRKFMNERLLSSLIIALASVLKKPHILGSVRARARIDLWVGPYHFSNLFVSFPRGRPWRGAEDSAIAPVQL